MLCVIIFLKKKINKLKITTLIVIVNGLRNS